MVQVDLKPATGEKLFSRLFRRPTPAAVPATPDVGESLIYAVGDIHGRLDLLNALIVKICNDVVAVEPARRPVLILLGDYIDRGPDSRGVIDRILALKQEAAFEVHALKGNHEEQALAFVKDERAGPAWAEFGGLETLTSYGVRRPAARTSGSDWSAARDSFVAALPDAHLDFLGSLELAMSCGDYLFVHAGVRPGVALADQSERDLLWIRDEFLSSDRRFEKVVVHGHSPEPAPFIGRNRIGIDTGAYATGTLTALRLHHETQFILQTGPVGQ